MAEPRDPHRPAGARGSRQPGSRPRRVVAAPTGAPGDAFEDRLPTWAGGSDDEGVPAAAPAPGPVTGSDSGTVARGGGVADERAWAAEAERLLADRPPHWG
ncbi:hypothetical protein [Quadrisphaera sp. INWT6]|uniref:hypothetical protein n=1 Tax=Quadrisphaera sp. INWT6 TaxID=2596917 RepID=UPI0018920E17|nr:hypothetical protein [Quadrisphaera sp. INWT6]MBF5080246.1 hypothetical protein [Quadrisphaera sp. INWT6]